MTDLACRNIDKLMEQLLKCNKSGNRCTIELNENNQVVKWIIKKATTVYKPSPLGQCSQTFEYDNESDEECSPTLEA